jgi:hypothetical protein
LTQSKTNSPGIAAASTPKMPGEVVRGLVSLWLIIHLLAISLALATDTGMGRSELLARVKRAPILYQYLYALWLDTDHSYRLTNGAFDGNYSIETELVYTDGHHSEPTELQPADAHGERLERYQALANRAAVGAENESPDTTLPNYLGGAILKRLKEDGVNEVIFRVRRRAPLSMTDAVSSDPGQRNPTAPRTLTNLFEASVTLNSSGEPQVQVKSQSARDVAPVTNPATTQVNPQPRARTPIQPAPSSTPAFRPVDPGINLDDRTPTNAPPTLVPPVGGGQAPANTK